MDKRRKLSDGYYIRRLGQLADRNAQYLRGKVLEWLAFINEQISEDLTDRYLKGEMDEVIQWGKIDKKGKEVMKSAMMVVVERGGKFGVTSVNPEAMFDMMTKDIVESGNKMSMELITNVSNETKQGIRAYVSEGLAQGKGMPKVARELRPIVGLTKRQMLSLEKYRRELLEESPGMSEARLKKKLGVKARRKNRIRAARIARTESARAQNMGYCRGLEQEGIEQVEFSRATGCCDLCDSMSGNLYKVGTGASIIPVHPNCLVGDSLVSPVGRIAAATKRWFDGKIHIIKTSTNRKIICTKHHPILTDSGFVPAYKIDVGSDVICDGFSQGKTFSDWCDVNKPSTAKNIAESFFSKPSVLTKEVPVSAPDFHNDGFGSKVAIVGTDSFLMNGSNPSFLQHTFDKQFSLRKVARSLFNRLGVFAFSRPRDLSAFRDLMCRLNLFMSLFGIHLRPFELLCLGTISNVNFPVEQSFANTPSANTQPVSNSFFRPTSNIQFNNLRDDFFRDSVIHHKTFQFNDYVYNFQTTQSYIIAGGIASHNCRCAMIPVVKS